jgi:hypothetical protein
MADDRGPKDADGLAWLALLYAGGELTEAEADQFEQRLAGDQQAREALAQAAPLALPPGQPLAPDPAYRQRVHRRLRRRSRPAGLQCSMSWLVQRRSYPGHPILWSTAGAAAAALLTTLTFLLGMPTSAPVTAGHRPAPAAPGGEAPAEEAAQADVANAWARLHTTDHVARAHDEEMRRKSRIDPRTRPASKFDDHHSHPLGNQGNKR